MLSVKGDGGEVQMLQAVSPEPSLSSVGLNRRRSMVAATGAAYQRTIAHGSPLFNIPRYMLHRG